MEAASSRSFKNYPIGGDAGHPYWLHLEQKTRICEILCKTYITPYQNTGD